MTELTIDDLKTADPNPNEPALEQALHEQFGVFAGYEADIVRVLLRAYLRSGRALGDSDVMTFLAEGLRANFEPGSVSPEAASHVRAWIPDFAIGDEDHSPRVIGHHDDSALSDEKLKELYERAVREDDIDREGVDVADEFEAFLLRQGYRVFHLTTQAQGMFIVPVEG